MFQIKKLLSKDIDDVKGFIEGQFKTIHNGFFFPPTLKIIVKSLGDTSGISHGAFYDNELIGIRLTYFPSLETENHGYDLGYSEEELKQVAQFHGTLVINDKRYKGIGSELVHINCKEIFNTPCKRILATAHPDNHASINMLLNNGFKERMKVYKYENLPRIIFEKKKS